MSRPASLLKLIRQLHLYLGVFIAPSILFFAITGAMQSLNLHETLPGRNYKPATWIMVLAQVHKKQTIELRKPHSEKPEEPNKAVKIDKPATPVKAPDIAAPAPKSHLPLKIFCALVSLTLAFSTVSGLYMAYTYNRSKLMIGGLLLAGIAIPLLLLRF
jgi:hypothetical protein